MPLLRPTRCAPQCGALCDANAGRLLKLCVRIQEESVYWLSSCLYLHARSILELCQ